MDPINLILAILVALAWAVVQMLAARRRNAEPPPPEPEEQWWRSSPWPPESPPPSVEERSRAPIEVLREPADAAGWPRAHDVRREPLPGPPPRAGGAPASLERRPLRPSSDFSRPARERAPARREVQAPRERPLPTTPSYQGAVEPRKRHRFLPDSPREARRAIVLMTVLGPCRALEPRATAAPGAEER